MLKKLLFILHGITVFCFFSIQNIFSGWDGMLYIFEYEYLVFHDNIDPVMMFYSSNFPVSVSVPFVVTGVLLLSNGG